MRFFAGQRPGATPAAQKHFSFIGFFAAGLSVYTFISFDEYHEIFNRVLDSFDCPYGNSWEWNAAKFVRANHNVQYQISSRGGVQKRDVAKLNQDPETLFLSFQNPLWSIWHDCRHAARMSETRIWLEKYVGSADFLKPYDDRSLMLMAEATFWSVHLGLEPLLAEMRFAEIKNFQPLAESMATTQTRRACLIQQVSKKLKQPKMSHEASYALGMAAFCVYARHHSFAKLQEEEKLYETGQKLSF